MNKKTIKDNLFKHHQKNYHCHSSSVVYGLGFIGSAVYYITIATSFWMGVIGVLKSIVWPAFLVYGLLKFLGM
jgi:hypothetical protein